MAGAVPSVRKKRWYGDKSGGGVKTALGVKRKPNRKDRERARAKLGTTGGGVGAGGDSTSSDAAVPAARPKPDASVLAGRKKTKAPSKQAAGAGSPGNGGQGAGQKRKFGDGNTPFDRHDKHKQQKAVVPPVAPPVLPRPVPKVPKSEKGQKLQELLRAKLAKANALKGIPDAPPAEPVAQHTAESAHTGKGTDGEGGAAARGADQESKDVDVTVVKGKVATGKVSSNWQAMKKELKKDKRLEKKGKKSGGSEAGKGAASAGAFLPTPLQLINCVGPLAIDCEMVGVGDGGHRSVLARASIVDGNGEIVIDTFVAPQEKVTDYRTKVSGVRPQDLKGAPMFQDVQNLVSIATKNKVIIGHSIQNDLKALLLTHDKKLIRDTAKYRPYQNAAKKPRKLRDLAKELLGMDIQGGEHSSVEDARATLLLYKLASAAWEKEMAATAAKLEKRSKKKPMAKKRERD